MKKFILFSLALFLYFTASSQDLSQTIKGTVVDQQSQYPLFGVTVLLLDSEPLQAINSDFEGNFKLENVPVGRQSLRISYVGYETQVMGNLVVTSGKELVLEIQLTESVNSLGKVEIVAEKSDKRESINKMATVSSRTFSVEEAGRYSGTLQDPARMAQNYAGVSGASDDRNDIIIRGNSPLGVLWRMEGIDIPSPNHFSTLGTTGGPISMLNINNLSNSDFATSAWSADYGNALSGVFDLTLRDGNTDKREYLGQIGFNGFEFGAEGPFKKGSRASYMFNYRYSTLGVIGALGLDVGTGAAVPEYQDLTFKLNLPTEKLGKIAIWGVMGKSFIHFEPDSMADANLFTPNDQDSKFSSATIILGANQTKFINENSYTKLNIAYSNTVTEGYIDEINFETNAAKRLFGADRRQEKISANFKYNLKVNALNTFSAGVIGNLYNLNTLDSTIMNQNTPEEFMLLISDNKDEKALLGQFYVNWQHRFNEKWTANLGLHSQHLLLNSTHAIEPRIGIKYQVKENHILSAGVGKHSQLQPITVYFIDEYDQNLNPIGNPNKDLDFTKAYHAVLSHDWFITKDLRLKTEIYLQYIFDAPVDSVSSAFSMLNEGVDFILPVGIGYQNNGTGSNKGLEITFEKFFSKGYYFLMTTSIFESNYKGSDGVERNTVFNSNIVYNLAAGKEFTFNEKNIFSIDAKFTYSGGRRYTPIDFESSEIAQREIRFEDRAYEEQYDPYIKGDLKFSYKRNGKKIAQVWSLDIQNLTNNKNVFLTQYDVESNSVITQYQRGFFPMFLYQVYF